MIKWKIYKSARNKIVGCYYFCDVDIKPSHLTDVLVVGNIVNFTDLPFTVAGLGICNGWNDFINRMEKMND